jgi:hypothetical protein
MRYAVITTVDIDTADENGNPHTLPAGTVTNVVLWDGVAPYDPGATFTLQQSDTLQIGDVVEP